MFLGLESPARSSPLTAAECSVAASILNMGVKVITYSICFVTALTIECMGGDACVLHELSKHLSNV